MSEVIYELKHYKVSLLTEEEGKDYEVGGLIPRYAIIFKEGDVIEALESLRPRALESADQFDAWFEEWVQRSSEGSKQLSLVEFDRDEQSH